MKNITPPMQNVQDATAIHRNDSSPDGKNSPLGMAFWHDTVVAALNKFSAKKIALLTPFDPTGDRNARAMFEELGFEVVSSFGFACKTAVDIAHVPDAGKKAALRKLVEGENVDAIVQCVGTGTGR